MADKLSTGSSSSTFKTVSTDIGVIGMQGKALKYEKLQYWQQNNNNNKKTTKKKQKKKKTETTTTTKPSNKMLIWLLCIWHLRASWNEHFIWKEMLS